MSLKHVDARTAHELQSNDDHTYVDVRSIPEFENGHPAGARNVPLLNRDRQTGQMQPNPEFLAVMQANYSPGVKASYRVSDGRSFGTGGTSPRDGGLSRTLQTFWADLGARRTG